MALHTLNYPIYSVSFDPHNSDFLFVGGGGGEGRSGVPNKVSLLDTSNAVRNELREITHIDLSRDEDSVSSLAVAQSSETEATVFAGINSSQKEQAAGNNEHLRSIKVPYPQRRVVKSGQSTISVPTAAALSKASLFTPGKESPPETYQRVLRLSPASRSSSKRLGAVATGLAPNGEVVIFDASTPTPNAANVIKRILVGSKEEAGDVDILDTAESEYRVAYCTDGNLYCLDVKLGSKTTITEPYLVFKGSKQDGSFRSLRFITKDLVLLVRNFPRKRGAQILIAEVPQEPGEGKIVYGLALPKGFNAATALDVARLPAIDNSEKIQYLVASSGQDGSIVLFTLDFTPNKSRRLLLKKHTVYRDIHPAGITSLAFSKFPPSNTEVPNKPIRIKLASTSFGNTVAVHTLPLKPRPTPKQATHHVLALPVQRSFKDEFMSYITAAFLIALLSISVAAIGELTGSVKQERLGIRNWAPDFVKELFDVPREVGFPEASAPVIVDNIPPIEPAAAARAASRQAAKEARDGASQVSSAAAEAATTIIETLTQSPISVIDEITQHIPPPSAAGEFTAEAAAQAASAAREKISSILDANRQKQDLGPQDPESRAVTNEDAAAPGAVLFRDSEHGLSVSTHEHESHVEDVVGGDGAKKWEDLSKHEKHLWRSRLKQAGHWVEGETEVVLKGIFFGTIAGVVGAAVGG